MPFQERRRFPRPMMSRELLRLDRLNRVFQVQDLSPHTCSLVWDEASLDQPFHILQYLGGILSTTTQRLSVQIQVQGITKDQIRTRLFLQSRADEGAWKDYFEPERLAKSLRLVPFDATNHQLLFMGDADTSIFMVLREDGSCQRVTIRARGYILKTHVQEGTEISYAEHSSGWRPSAVVLQQQEPILESSQLQEATYFFLKFIETFAKTHALNQSWCAWLKREIEDIWHKQV